MPDETTTLVWLRQASDNELREAFAEAPSALAEMPDSRTIPAELIWWELNQRRADRRTNVMASLTWAIGAMTLVNTVFVILSAIGVLG